MTDSYFKRPELHIIKGNGNKVLEKLDDIDRKVDFLRMVKPLPVSDTSQADSGATTLEQELPKSLSSALADLPLTEDIPIETKKTVNTPTSGVITKINEVEVVGIIAKNIISNVIQFPIKAELSFYERVLRLFKNIIICIKEF